MEKILTIFERDEKGNIQPKLLDECRWIFDKEVLETEKLDGTNVRLTVRNKICVRVEKRRNPSKKQKKLGIREPWYVDADENDPSDRHIFDAVKNTNISDWPDGEHCCEAIGPKIQGNPLNLEKNICYPFNLVPPKFNTPVIISYHPDYNDEQVFHLFYTQGCGKPSDLFSTPDNVVISEGVVFHHPDGRRAKLKWKDFAYLNREGYNE